MQTNYDSLDMMAVIRTYASSLGPTPIPEYRVLHSPIRVPPGYLPIRIAQFLRADRSLYHWAIFIPTSTKRGIGIFYELAGAHPGAYFYRSLVHGRHPLWTEYERGSHLVGYVAPSFLAMMEAHLAMNPIEQDRPDRNARTWVVEALRGLHHAQLCAVQMGYGGWVEQMQIVQEAWEVGDA